MEGLQEGFRIGYNYDTENMRSAHEHLEVVSEYLSQEIRQGRILGSFSSPPIQRLANTVAHKQLWGHSEMSPAREVVFENGFVRPRRQQRQ